MKKSPVQNHFDNIAASYDQYKSNQWYYYQSLKLLLKTIIPKGKSILEIGCGTGDLISSLHPSIGVGIDLSTRMIDLAKQKHPENNIEFKVSDVTSLKVNNKFNFIFMSDVIEHLESPESSFKKIAHLMTKETTFINTMANPKWEWILMLAERLHLKMPEGPHKRITINEIEIFLRESGLKIIQHDYTLLIPLWIPVITKFSNTVLENNLKPYAFIEYFLAKKI